MTAGSEEQPIRLEPEETCPASVALIVGFQGAHPGANGAERGTIRSSGLDDSYLAWSVFASMVICAVITAAQGFHIERFCSGHVALTYPAALFIAIMVGAVNAAGRVPSPA